MAAGLGFKTFTTGEVLTAADVNGYLMQGVLVFATEAARNSAITSPQEGQFAYTKDNNSLWYYTGSAWVASGATGDIEGVTAGTGISGGGTSGTVTITNSMATEITAKADLIVGTGNAAFDNLAVGANGTVLTADSTVSPTGLKWAAPAGGAGLVLVSSTTIGTTVSSVTVSNAFSTTYDNYKIIVSGGSASGSATLTLQLGATTSAYYYWGISGNSGSTTVSGIVGSNVANFADFGTAGVNSLSADVEVSNAFLSKRTTVFSQAIRTTTAGTVKASWGFQDSDTSFTAFTIAIDGGATMTGGTIKVYGYQNS